MAGPHRALVDLGSWSRLADRPHRRRRRDVVRRADDDQHGASDVGDGHRAFPDDEPPGEHSILREDLLEEIVERRPRVGDPRPARQEAALRLSLQELLAVVEIDKELELSLHFLHRVEHLEAAAHQPRRNERARDERRDDLTDAADQVEREVAERAARQALVDVDRATEGDDRSEIRGAAVGRGLIAEHPAL